MISLIQKTGLQKPDSFSGFWSPASFNKYFFFRSFLTRTLLSSQTENYRDLHRIRLSRSVLRGCPVRQYLRLSLQGSHLRHEWWIICGRSQSLFFPSSAYPSLSGSEPRFLYPQNLSPRQESETSDQQESLLRLSEATSVPVTHCSSSLTIFFFSDSVKKELS